MPSTPVSRCPVLDITAGAVHAEAAALRAQGPAVLVELPGGVRAWSVTRHSVIREMTTDPRISRDPHRHWPGIADIPEGWQLAAITLQRTFVNAYGAEHRQRRRRLAPSFSPRRVAAMRPRVQATADALVARLAELAPGETADLRSALSLPLTMTVICDLFGVPESMRDRLGAAIDGIIDTTVTPEQSAAIQVELDACLTELVRRKRQAPGDDLTSDLLTGSVDGAPAMPEEELHDSFFLLIGAGYETAVNLITSAAHALLAHPHYRERIAENTLTWDDVIEETLRHEGPVMHLPLRYALADIDLGEGVLIRQGDPVLLAFAAAGRDPELHADTPDTFDPDRSEKEHLAFGHGPHYCLGAHLARLEAHVALTTLFDAFPRIGLAAPGPPPRIPSLVINGFAELPVVPRPREGAGVPHPRRPA
ncbi:cytochrome P450 [Murinocardiopsis flavida]|uniref:Cytochrome P450 n=1 Tax=Murinocardiopsis flavida TaxID=645275 RepID=A0A2P8CMP2_9ACTN|nr:cytochrome P450 [Murinocardiopsis flavida]PSK86213.1 cytochrome P450 [Murinocardiopsis flavida]